MKYLFSLLLLCVLATAQISIQDPIYVVGVAPTVSGISVVSFDLTHRIDSLVGFVEVPNPVGGQWSDNAQIDIDRENGLAYFVASNRIGSRDVTLFQYRYMINGTLLAVPEEVSRCTFGGEIFMFSELFLTSTGDIYGFLRNGGTGPNLFKISKDCALKDLGQVPPTAAMSRVELLLKNDRLYYPSGWPASLVEFDIATLSTKRYSFPMTNRRVGFGGYQAIDQNTGMVWMGNTNGNFGDPRSWVFDPATQDIIETQRFRLPNYLQVFNLNSHPLVVSLDMNSGRWIAADPIDFVLEAWNSTRALTHPERSGWRIHTLNLNTV